eukprot:8218323-Alexandrium_andersonii.AAC.1
MPSTRSRDAMARNSFSSLRAASWGRTGSPGGGLGIPASRRRRRCTGFGTRKVSTSPAQVCCPGCMMQQGVVYGRRCRGGWEWKRAGEKHKKETQRQRERTNRSR